MADETKSGARHSAQDQTLIQAIHDHALELGATSPQPKEWQPVAPAKQADDVLISFGDAVKAVGENTIEGYLVRWGNPDEPDISPAQDFFTPETYFGKRNAEGVDATLNHGIPIRKGLEWASEKSIGQIVKTSKDQYGLLARAILEADAEYNALIMEMVKQGKLKWSSGALSHLVKRTPMPNGTHRIDQWVIGEGALTPTPAEPRLPAIVSLKSYLETGFDFEGITQEEGNAPQAEPQADATTDAAQAASVAEGNNIQEADKSATEEKTMDDQKTASVELLALKETQEAQAKELAALKAKFDAPASNGNPGVVVPAVKKVTDLGFKDDEVKSFLYWIRTGDDAAYKAAMQGQTDGEGGYAVPDDFYNQIVAKRNEVSVMRMAGVQVIPTSLDRLLVPTENVAATKFVVTAEEGAYDENEPTLDQVAITVHKLTKLIKISEELEADAKANFGAYLSGVWGRALGLAENYYFVNVAANGTAQPQSVTYASTATSAVASQTATTAAELLTLIYSLGSGYSDNMALLMRRTTLGAIRALAGNPFQFMATPAGTGGANTQSGAAGTLHNVPVFLTDELPAQAAANKPIVVFNPSFYMIAEREGLTVSRNPWLYQANGQIGLFARARMGGALLQALAAYHLLSKT